jgi:SAM-dependent methyltransferase
LQQHYAGKFSYVGVDLSEKLLAYAKKDHPKLKFVCEDMSEFIVRQKQESFDVIIGVASFQHIPSYRERLFLMKHFYRALRYDGLLIMTNRSLSHRFLKKHWGEMLHSWFRSLVSWGKLHRRDIYVPRTNKGRTFRRYYHLFTLSELKKLATFSGLQLRHLSYVDAEGKCTPKWKSAKNSFFVAQKIPILSAL